MTIRLYAEHLVNIRALSIQASLSTVSNQQTKATLSADGCTLRLEHEGEVATIKLPIQVPGGHNDATLTIPAAPTTDLSFRVQLQEKADSSGLLSNSTIESDNVVPWTADSLTPETSIVCKQCSSTLIGHGRIKLWKNLPSENWAEMMDFWHCHRPHVPHDLDHKTPVKGYSANSTLMITPGVGMVDPVDFVLAAEDCINLQVGTNTPGYAYYPFQVAVSFGHREPALSGRKVKFMGWSGYKCPKSNLQSAKPALTPAVGLAKLSVAVKHSIVIPRSS